MNRCFALPALAQAKKPRWPSLLALCFLGLGTLDGMAHATTRNFPPQAQRGTLQITLPPDAILNGQAARLSPGARIRGTNNLLILSGALQGQALPVLYELEQHGLVHNVWILTPQEAAQPWPPAP
jgi:hypothetical protein